jgi:hypothetical protein
MTTADLTGILAKIQRADELQAALQAELDAFIAKSCRVEGRFLDAPARYAFFAHGPPLLPLRFAVLVGEVVHHLRSVLDHAVTQLAAQGPGGGNPNVLEFPICRTPESFKSSIQRGKLRGVAEFMVQAIEALQPYYASGDLEGSPLLALHDLNRTDKHRLLLVIVAAVIMGDRLKVQTNADVDIVGMSPPLASGTRPTPEGKEIFTVFFGQRSDPSVDIISNFGFAAALEKVGAIRDVSVVDALTKMRDVVAQVLAKLFPERIKVAVVPPAVDHRPPN